MIKYRSLLFKPIKNSNKITTKIEQQILNNGCHSGNNLTNKSENTAINAHGK